MIRAEPRVAKLDADALDALDEALVIESGRLTQGGLRLRGAEALPAPPALSGIRDEILDAYKNGVTIAPQTETKPLIPLYKAAKLPLPPAVEVDYETYQFDFYVVQVIFGTTLPRDQFPLRAELAIKLQDDVSDAARRTRPVSLFPAHRDIELFKADLDIAVTLDASLNFSAPIPTPVAVGKAEVDAGAKTTLKIGPFHFAVHKAVVEVTGEGSQNILWRYAYDQHVGGVNDFKSLLVLKVAQETRRCEMAASIALVPYKPTWFFFKKVLPPINHDRLLPVTLVRPKGGKRGRTRR